MIDPSLIQKGTKIRVKDGAVLVIRGAYMSTGGIIVTANEGGGIVDRNVPYEDIVEVIGAGDK